MDWELAIEKNHEALKRILAMLVAMVGMTGAGGQFTFFPQEGSDASRQALAEKSKLSPAPTLNANADRPATLPRHLHRFVLRLLRPAEAATRRLIIIAAQGLTVTLPKFYERKPRPKKPPLNRKNGYGTGIVIRPGPLPEWAKALVPKRSPSLSLPLLDPLKRFGVRRRYAKPSAMPQIRVLGGDPIVPLFRQPEPPPPPPPSPDDPLDAARIHRRLDAIGRALDDLPKQAQRMARWHARRDARWARERGRRSMQGNRLWKMPPHRLALRARHLSPTGRGRGMSQAGAGARKSQAGAPPAPPQFLAPTQWGRGGEPEGRDGEGVNWEELGLTPEVLALVAGQRAVTRNRTSPPRPQNPAVSTASPRCGRAVRRDGAKGRTTMSTRC